MPGPYDPGGNSGGELAETIAGEPAAAQGTQKTAQAAVLHSFEGTAMGGLHPVKAPGTNTGSTNRCKDSAGWQWHAEQEDDHDRRTENSGTLLPQQPCFDPGGRDHGGGCARWKAHTSAAARPFDPGGGTLQGKRASMAQMKGEDARVVAGVQQGCK